ncbi:MAG: helix-turn-helix transcriptional regulator [bacterium]
MSQDFEQLRKTIGEQIRVYRERKGLSQAKARTGTTITRDTWSKCERGVAPNPTLSTLWEIAGALNVHVADLIAHAPEGSLTPEKRELLCLLRECDADTLGALTTALKKLLND